MRSARRRLGLVVPSYDWSGLATRYTGVSPISLPPVYSGAPAQITVPAQAIIPDINTYGGGVLPSGSYQITSRNAYVDGAGYLHAECERIDGTWQQSPPLYYLDCAGDIANIDGVLTCSHESAAPSPAPVATAVDPTTGQVVSSIPPNGPQPPGAGFQQVEAPGSPYPYVYIGGGQAPPPAAYNYTTALPWSVYQSYAAGETVSYGGVTWTALAPSTGIPPGTNSGYWAMAGGSPYSYRLAQTSHLPAGSLVGGQVVGSSFNLSNFFSQYKWWILGGLAAAVALPRITGRR